MPFAQTGVLTVIRLVYRSRNAIAVPGSRVLVHFNDIVATARKHNERVGICGFLLFDHRRFYQVLEGPTESLDPLLARILRDRRHRDVEVLQRVPIDTPSFAGWSMASYLGEPPGERFPADTPLDAEAFLAFALQHVAGMEESGRRAAARLRDREN